MSASTVTVPFERMPEPKAFAWRALVSAMSMAPFWGKGGDGRMLVGAIEAVCTRSGGNLWVWDHNGCGDFVRMSSSRHDSSRRKLVVFSHESQRSPYGDDKLADGFEHLSQYTIEDLLNSDLSDENFKPSFVSMTSYYECYGMPKFTPDSETGEIEVSLEDVELRWVTSPVIADLNEDLSSYRPDEIEEDYLAFYDRLMAGEEPTLVDFCTLMGTENGAAAAFLCAWRIRRWLNPVEGF